MKRMMQRVLVKTGFGLIFLVLVVSLASFLVGPMSLKFDAALMTMVIVGMSIFSFTEVDPKVDAEMKDEYCEWPTRCLYEIGTVSLLFSCLGFLLPYLKVGIELICVICFIGIALILSAYALRVAAKQIVEDANTDSWERLDTISESKRFLTRLTKGGK
jgi:hypothetical protein